MAFSTRIMRRTGEAAAERPLPSRRRSRRIAVVLLGLVLSSWLATFAKAGSDPALGPVYYTTSDAIWRIASDWTSSQPIVAGDMIVRESLQLLPAVDRMVWAEWDVGTASYRFRSARLDGSDARPEFGVYRGTVDPNANKIYYFDSETGALSVVNFDGTDPRPLGIDRAGPGSIGRRAPALDPQGEWIYWSEVDEDFPGSGFGQEILRVNVHTLRMQTLGTVPADFVLFDARSDFFFSIFSDPVNNLLHLLKGDLHEGEIIQTRMNDAGSPFGLLRIPESTGIRGSIAIDPVGRMKYLVDSLFEDLPSYLDRVPYDSPTQSGGPKERLFEFPFNPSNGLVGRPHSIRILPVPVSEPGLTSLLGAGTTLLASSLRLQSRRFRRRRVRSN